MTDTLGVYISVPFCRAKCTYCNFASGVFSADRMDAYVDRLCTEITELRGRVEVLRAELPRRVDSVYLGGGTPSLLSAEQLGRVFAAVRETFDVIADAEITLECAPGQLGDPTLQALLQQGMNRVSFGVQSFVDAESRAVGRLHTRQVCLEEIERLRRAGVQEINVDLIVGLPGQTAESWRESVDVAIATGVPHISMYMLEVDEDSRLGREILAAGSRFGAGKVPEEDSIAEWYHAANKWLEQAGVHQYEISNFAREGHSSHHNLKYWKRDPYVGFGLDAHSMLGGTDEVLRLANPSDLDVYLGSVAQTGLPMLGAQIAVERIDREGQFEESIFLGLRMNEGVSLTRLREEFGEGLVDSLNEPLRELREAGLIEHHRDHLRLTMRGRMASNEVFSRLLVVPA